MTFLTRIRRRVTWYKHSMRMFRKYVRDGGVTYVNVSKTVPGNILKGKKILITGGSRGIGLEMAKKFVSQGAVVVISGRSAENLDSARLLIDNHNLRTILWDISNISGVNEKLAQSIELAGGNLDIVVNNAGVYPGGDFESTTEAMWDSAMNTNAKGPFFLSQAISKQWIAKGAKGKIINIASSGGTVGAMTPYRMSKWSMVGLTRGLGLLLFPKGIIVNGIGPGMTSSDMLGFNADDNAFADYPPSNRVARPEEIAELALYLASDTANYVVGQTIVCDGGYSLKN